MRRRNFIEGLQVKLLDIKEGFAEGKVGYYAMCYHWLTQKYRRYQ
jgi:hypothetical protein